MVKRKLDINNELSDISQTVANLPRENPFSVPDNYFENYSPLRTPKIELLPKENPFQLPEGYFEQFKLRKSRPKTIGIFNTNGFIRYAAAACITGVLITLFLLIDKIPKEALAFETSKIRQTELSSDAVESFLSDAENMTVATETDEFVDSGDNALVDLNSEMVGQLLSELSENGLSQYMNLNELNDTRTNYN